MKNQVTLRVGGYTFATADNNLVAASVTKARKKKGSSATATLRDPRLVLANALPLPAANARVVFALWWGPLNAQRLVFEGYLVTMAVDAKSQEITLNAIDRSRAARRVERARNRAGMTLEELARQVAEDAELALDADRSAVAGLRAFSALVQHGETDWDLLTRLCAGVGVDAWVEGATLYLRKVGTTDASQGPPLRVRAGQDVVSLSFEVEEKTRRTTSNVVNLRGEPVLEGGEPGAVQRLVTLGRTGILLASEDTPSYTDQTVEQALKAGARQRKVFTASLEVAPGLPLASLRRGVFIEGFGARWDGAWVVDTFTHNLGADRTRFALYNDGAP